MNAATSNLTVDRAMTPKFMRSEALSLRNVRPDDIVHHRAVHGIRHGAQRRRHRPGRRAQDGTLGLALQKDDVAGYLAENS